MQQILAVLKSDADGAALTQALGNGTEHSYLDPSVLIVDGDETVQSALNQAPGVIATLSDDAATKMTADNNITQLDVGGMATLIGSTLGVDTSFEEPIVIAIAGWAYGFSPQFQASQSERPREGDTWDMPGGCLPTDDNFANS